MIDLPPDLALGASATRPVAGRGRWVDLLLRLARGLFSAAVSIGVVLLAWWAFLEYFEVKPFLGKTPADVWQFLVTGDGAAANRQVIVDESRTTLRDAFLGLAAGSLAAVGAAGLFNVWRPVERTLMPIAMVLRSVPLVAMTPLIVLVLGRGLVAVAAITGIVTFFPTLVNVTLALRSTPRDSIDLLRAYGASPAMTLWKVQVPSSLPALFASLRIAAPLALVGALLSEWLATGEVQRHVGPGRGRDPVLGAALQADRRRRDDRAPALRPQPLTLPQRRAFFTKSARPCPGARRSPPYQLPRMWRRMPPGPSSVALAALCQRSAWCSNTSPRSQ
jgi:ABC-type nitrate/sulfonate/bicarbonate transport system permease component